MPQGIAQAVEALAAQGAGEDVIREGADERGGAGAGAAGAAGRNVMRVVILSLRYTIRGTGESHGRRTGVGDASLRSA